ncbi:TraG family conjugative transposon ATPase [Chitinophaga sp. XS-30]|nr:TraG family conjugative transposon ATPase [Chitinophaga sp. XS-30]
MEAHFPLYKVEDDAVLSKQGDVTVGFRLALPEIFTLSNEEYEALHHVWLRAIKILPAGCIVHKQDWFVEDTYQPDTAEEKSFLSAASDRFFNERPFLAHQTYVFVTRKDIHRRPASSVLSNLLRPALIATGKMEQRQYDEFKEKTAQFEKLLAEGGFITPVRLSTDEWCGTDRHTGILERYCGLLEEKELPGVTDIEFKPEFRIGSKYCQLYTLSDVDNLPSICGPRVNYDAYSTDKTRFSVSFAAPIGQLLHCNHVYNQVLVIEDTSKTLKKMEARRRRLQSLSRYSRENAINLDATNAYLNESIAHQRTPVRAHFSLLAWTEDRNQLTELRNRVSAALAQMDALPYQETASAAQLYWACLPGNIADLPLNETFESFMEQATCFLSQETGYESSVSSFGIRLGDRQTGKPVLTDLSDLPMKLGWTSARNRFILGPSGSGKSFFTNHMVRSYYEQGTHIVLIDVGHSYKGLCDLVGGYYFTYSEDNPIKFNPFYIEPGDTLDTEKKESIKTLLLSLWKKDTEGFTRSEYIALSNLLGGYYEHLDNHPEIFPCFNSFYEFLRDHYLEVFRRDNLKERDFNASNFMYVMRSFYQGGEFDYLLNATENLNLLHQPLVIFELDAIKENAILLPAVTLIIMQVFISKMRKLKGVRKMILIEEAWKAIAREGMAEYIKYLFKTVRKFFGEAIVVTQEVEDIISSPVVKQAIINNSDCKILLDQTKYQNKFGLIQELLGITDKQKAEIFSLNKNKEPGRVYKEVWIDLGGHSKVYRIEVSPEEYYIYTTEQKEKVLVEKYTEKYGSIRAGVKALVADLKNKAA